MQIQTSSPDIDILDINVPGNLFSKKYLEFAIDVSDDDSENKKVRVKIDIETVIGEGSFGSIYPCVMSLIKNNKLMMETNTNVVKLTKKLCTNEEGNYKELIIHSLIHKTINNITPGIYDYMINIKSPGECYEGIIQNNISNGSFHIYKNKLCDINTNKTLFTIVNEYFKMVNKLKKVILDLYKMYKFKHNDLHVGNVLFHDFSPKIIDYGESTLMHIFEDKNLNFKHDINNIKDIYDNDSNELIELYYKYPLTDLHLYIFSCYGEISNSHGILPTKNITSNYISRIEDIYSLTKLKVIGEMIVFDQKIIEKKDEFSYIYSVAKGIIKRSSLAFKIQGVKACWNYIFEDWNSLWFRHMSFFYEIYLSDEINYDAYFKDQD